MDTLFESIYQNLDIPEGVAGDLEKHDWANCYEHIYEIETIYDGKIFLGPELVPTRDEKYNCTVILDLDLTLICLDKCSMYIFVRQHARLFLKYLKTMSDNKVEVILWTAGSLDHAKHCLYILDKDESFFDYIICRGKSWFGNESLVKSGIISNFPGGSVDFLSNPDIYAIPLKCLKILKGRNERDTIIIDDSKTACFLNENNCMLAVPFSPCLIHETGGKACHPNGFDGLICLDSKDWTQDKYLLEILKIIVTCYKIIYEEEHRPPINDFLFFCDESFFTCCSNHHECVSFSKLVTSNKYCTKIRFDNNFNIQLSIDYFFGNEYTEDTFRNVHSPLDNQLFKSIFDGDFVFPKVYRGTIAYKSFY